MSRRVSKPLRTLYHEPIQAEACLRGNRPQDGTSPWWRYVINFIRVMVGLGFMKAQVFMKKNFALPQLNSLLHTPYQTTKVKIVSDLVGEMWRL